MLLALEAHEVALSPRETDVGGEYDAAGIVVRKVLLSEMVCHKYLLAIFFC